MQDVWGDIIAKDAGPQYYNFKPEGVIMQAVDNDDHNRMFCVPTRLFPGKQYSISDEAANRKAWEADLQLATTHHDKLVQHSMCDIATVLLALRTSVSNKLIKLAKCVHLPSVRHCPACHTFWWLTSLVASQQGHWLASLDIG